MNEGQSGFATGPLFALDEATMLAAGHRPCFLCRRGAFTAFRDAWCMAHGLSAISADDMDRELHAARLDDAGRQVKHSARLNSLPNGVMVALSGSADRAALVWNGAVHPWSHGGYSDPEHIEPGQIVTVLTPQPTIRVLAAGYRPAVALSRLPPAIPRREIAEYPATVDQAP